MVTVLSRSSIEGHNDLKAIPIEGSEGLMTGSFHVLRDAYRKHSMKAFVDILVQATTVHKRMGLLD